MPDCAFDAQRRERLRELAGRRCRAEFQVLPALRTDRRAFENGRLAVWAGPGPAGSAGRGTGVEHWIRGPLLAAGTLVLPTEVGLPAHPRASRDGERPRLDV